MKDLDIEGLFFKEPLILFYSDGESPKTRVIPTMEALMDLMNDIQENGWEFGVGAMTIEFQLWFALARQTMFKPKKTL